MNEELPLELPPEIEKLRDTIEATIKPYVEIRPTPNAQTTLWQSKLGGLPYFPQGLEYPRSPDGNYLYLLTQINFAEVPPLENFPTQGILQFYIGDDEFYGCDFNNPTQQLKFRILYFPEPKRDVSQIIEKFALETRF
jgi:uncharacterized protein YwqG